MSKSIDPEEDFLDVDREIPGQKFVCISFVSPEKIIGRRHLFNVHQYLLKKAEDYKLTLKGLESDYDDFVYANAKELEKRFEDEVVPKEFHEGATSIRGVKVRGTYSTQREAAIRAKVLQRMDKNFHVFIGQVGYWLPWDPEADYIEGQEYGDKDLNKLMKAYKENMDNRDMLYEEETRARIEKAKEEGKRGLTVEEVVEEESAILKDSIESELSRNLEERDPWMARKEAGTTDDGVKEV